MNRRILIVDDEIDLADLLAYNLKAAGYDTHVAHNGRDGLDAARALRPHIIVLDVMMPELSGLEVAARLRAEQATKDIPILMLTARADEADEVRGLSAGADDFVAKPFSMKVLEARVEALLRRTNEAAQTRGDQTLVCGPVVVDTNSHEVTVDGRTLQLTVTEFRLLAALLSAGGHVLSRAALINQAMGKGVTVTERTIDVHVTSIRKKLGQHSAIIRTVRGVGYRMSPPGNADAGTDPDSKSRPQNNNTNGFSTGIDADNTARRQTAQP
ncbi:MAG: response regulator transcription factor [Planctomycetota bacterium]